ncbi:MAG: ABC transporter substrate-binding protein, partial [Ardenticatenaceae bacterium]
NWGLMTAEDVAWSMNDAGVDNPNSKHSAAGEINVTFQPFVAVDEFTVEAPFKTYRGDFISFNTVSDCHDSVGIVSKKAFDELGVDGARVTPIGTGPFVVKNWLPKERIEAEARTEHWRIVPDFKNLVIIEAPEGAVRTAMLETGEADISAVPIPDVTRLQDKGFAFHEGLRQFQGNFIYFAGNYWMDTVPETGEPVARDIGFKPDDQHPWIGDPNDPARMESAREVRWAMAMAIDRDAISQTILGGFGGPIYGGGTGQGFHQADPEFKEKWVIPYDPEQAKQRLTEAGYPDGFDVQLYCAVDIGVSREVCLAVAGMWQENLGLNVSLDTAAYTSRRPTMVGREMNIPWIAPWGPNRVSAVQETGGTCGCRLFAEPTGGYNPGIEVDKLYEFYQLTSSRKRPRLRTSPPARRSLTGTSSRCSRLASWKCQPLSA